MNSNLVKQLINRFLAQAMKETQSDELSLSALRVFLSIPEGEGGVSQTQVVKSMTDVSSTTVSRHIAFLAGLDARRKSTLAEPLIESIADPVDRRYKYLKLTPAGVALQRSLCGDFLDKLIVKEKQ